MPQISNKAVKMPQSPIRKLVPYAENAKKQGKKVFHLNIGQPDIKTPTKALDAIKSNNIEILSYSPSEGIASYRERLVEYYNSNQIKIELDNLIVTTGGSEALFFALSCVADMGDEIIISEPYYANYSGFCTSSGLTIQPVTSSIENGFALPSIKEFENKITPKTKAILICNPNNPTGYLYSKEELERLKDIVLKHDLFLIVDEVYREFVYDGKEHTSILNFPELHNHAIVIDSVSKRFSMCGARIGCMISRNQEIMDAALKFAQARLSPPTYAQLASEAALEVDKNYFEEVNQEYITRRNFLVEALNTIDGVECNLPSGAFYCIAKLPVDDAEDFAKWLLSDFHLNNQTIMIAPAGGFYITPGLGKNEVRIAYVLNVDDLKICIEILREALKEYLQR